MKARYTVNEAAEALGYSIWTLYDMIRDGEIGCIRRGGGSIRILQRHIDEFDSQNECPALPSKNRNPNSSRSPDGGNTTSAGPKIGALKSLRLARKARPKRSNA